MAKKHMSTNHSNGACSPKQEQHSSELSQCARVFVDAASYVLHRWDGRSELSDVQRAAVRLCRGCPTALLQELDDCLRLRGNALREGLASLRTKLGPSKPLLAALLA